MNSRKLPQNFNIRRFKSVLAGFAVSLTVFTILLFNSEALAQNLQDVQRKLQQANQQINENKKLAEEAKKETSTLQGITNRLQSDINTAQTAIKNLENQINNSIKDIENKNKAIAAKQKELELQEAHQDEIIKTIYETSEQDTVLMLAGSGSIAEIINHAEYLESLESDIELTIKTVQDITEELQKDKEELEVKRKELTENKAQQQAYRAGLLSEKNTQDELKAEAQRQYNAYQANIANATTLRKKFEAEIAEIERLLSIKKGIVQNTGPIRAPVNRPFKLTQKYGPPTVSWYNFHDGVDLANLCGTPILAATDGVVEIAAYGYASNPCGNNIGRYYDNGAYPTAFGNYIVINSTNGIIRTGYGHLLSLKVKKGQTVKKGDVIGYMGSTGLSSGSHLHFQVWNNGNKQNPLSYLQSIVLGWNY